MIHGGDIYTNGVFKGVELLDFSSNINPLGVPNSFKNNINEALNNCVRYPDIKYRQILKSLSSYVNLDEDNFILGNGASEIINLCVSNFKNILVVVPSFSEYESDALKNNSNITYSFLNENMEYDYEDILEKMKTNDALIIGNPNNPNGSLIDKKRFRSILNFCRENNKYIIIDEAFIEFTGNKEDSFVFETKAYKNIFIIRAITKFFGMPGIRFGYGISSNENLIESLKLKQEPWNINCFAEVAIKYIFKDEEYIKKSLDWINTERIYLTNKLKNIKFIEKVFDTNANFILVKLKNVDCESLYNFCLSKNILIRKCDNYKGLDKFYVRFAIKNREINKKLVEVLETFKKISY